MAIKGSDTQRFIVCEIQTTTCPAGTQINYKGLISKGRQDAIVSWGKKDESLEREWQLEKTLTIEETLLGEVIKV